MKLINKFIFSVILTATSLNSYCGIGLTDWSCETPNGNEINNYLDMPTLYLKDGNAVKDVSQWFFYKNYVLGQLNNNNFFIVNEKTLSVRTFESEQEWLRVRNKLYLNPAFWTRWYDGGLNFIDTILIITIIYFYVSIPLVLLLGLIFYKAIKKERLNIKKPFTLATAVLVGITLIGVLLESFPQSI